jgi:hypothetical protein
MEIYDCYFKIHYLEAKFYFQNDFLALIFTFERFFHNKIFLKKVLLFIDRKSQKSKTSLLVLMLIILFDVMMNYIFINHLKILCFIYLIILFLNQHLILDYHHSNLIFLIIDFCFIESFDQIFQRIWNLNFVLINF